jgi:hypothetical protein
MTMKRHELIRDHIKRIQDRYRDSDKRHKKTILDEFCHTRGIGRKYAIRLLGGKCRPTGKRAGRPPKYDGNLVRHLTVLWASMERIHPKRMKAAIPLWLPFYHDPEFNLKLKAEMLAMSASTIARFLKRGRKTLKGLSATRKAKFFKYKIPLHAFTDKIINAGHVAADTVAHCGDSLSGEFANSLTITDRLTTWTENRALFTKKEPEMEKALKSIEIDLPFRLLSIQSDCGTEFLNYQMMKFLQGRPRPVIMSRSRPYHKNDNAHVEQKNNTHVRNVFGYDRIEYPALVDLMNEIYRDYWNPLNNFFLPSMKLKEKERNGARITKRYEEPMTPYQRLMLAPNVSEERKSELKIRFKLLNPFELKRGLERKLELFFSLLKQTGAEKKAA